MVFTVNVSAPGVIPSWLSVFWLYPNAEHARKKKSEISVGNKELYFIFIVFGAKVINYLYVNQGWIIILTILEAQIHLQIN